MEDERMIRKELKNASDLIKIIGKQKDLLTDVDEVIRSYNSGDLEMDASSFEDLVGQFDINNRKLTDAIKQMLFSFREQ